MPPTDLVSSDTWNVLSLLACLIFGFVILSVFVSIRDEVAVRVFRSPAISEVEVRFVVSLVKLALESSLSPRSIVASKRNVEV